MAVVIKKKSTTVPVDFGEFTLEITVDDAKAQELKGLEAKYSEKIEALGDKLGLEEARAIVADLWDDLFGEGTGEKVYTFAGGSSVLSFDYLAQTITGVLDEWNKLQANDNLSKYLKK